MGSTLERQMMLEGPVCGVCVCDLLRTSEYFSLLFSWISEKKKAIVQISC